MNNNIDFNSLMHEAIIKSLVTAIQPNLEYQIPRKFFEQHEETLIQKVIEKVDENVIAQKVADLVVTELMKDDWYKTRSINRKRLTELTYIELAKRKADEINAEEPSNEA